MWSAGNDIVLRSLWSARTDVQAGARRRRRHSPAGALLGSPHVHACRAAGSGCIPTTSTRSARHRGGINERWFSSTTNADNGPGTPADEGLSYVRLESGERFLLKEAVDAAGDAAARRRRDAKRGRLEPPLQVLRQHGADSASHAPERCAREAGRAQGQAGGVLLSAAVQPDRQQLSLHVHGPRAGHDERRRAALPRELEQGRQRHPEPVARLPAAASAPAGRSIPASCTRPARSSPTSRR